MGNIDMADAHDYEVELEFCLTQVNSLLMQENKADSDWRALFIHVKLLSQLCQFRNYALEAQVSHYCPMRGSSDCPDATEKLGCSPNCYVCSYQCFTDCYGSEYQGRKCQVCGQVIPRETYMQLVGT